MATAEKIQDFGQKIGGARKDLYALNRMLNGDDIANWTDDERKHYLTKQQIFKKYDYDELMASGVSRNAAYFIKLVYDALPIKPPYPALDCQERYVNMLGYFKEKLDTVKTTIDAKAFFKTYITDSPYINVSGYSYGITAEGRDLFTNKLFRACQYNSYTIEKGIEARQFGYSEEEKLMHFYRCYYFNGKNANMGEDFYKFPKVVLSDEAGYKRFFEAYDVDGNAVKLNEWKDDTWVLAVPYENKLVEYNFPSKEAALARAMELYSAKYGKQPGEKTSTSKKTRYTPPQLEHIERIGEDYRNGQDITGDDMLKTFGFYGGEFGNWENQNDRQANLNMAFEAFKDLAKALDMSDKDVSLGNQLSMAWGARGHGSALAHFEPVSNVINLTKLRGAGSLAHEWGHALDRYIGHTTMPQYSMATDGWRRSESPLHDVMYSIYYRTLEDGTRTETDYYLNAKRFSGTHSTTGNQKGSDGKSGYWHSPVEMFARAFATYIMDKLDVDGKNDYLCGHAEMSSTDNKGVIYAYPVGEEREAINKQFDKLFDALKEQNLIAKREETENHKQIHTEYAESKKGVQIKELDAATTYSPLTAKRVGDFYEFYGKDICAAADVINEQLTTKGGKQMFGIAAFAANQCIDALKAAGFDVSFSAEIEREPDKEEWFIQGQAVPIKANEEGQFMLPGY